MIQLNVLSGNKAGHQTVARRFPFHIGRAAGNELQLDDAGVWDQHLVLAFQRDSGFTLTAESNALASVNRQPVQTAVLRNGDLITLGSVQLQFWLAAARQRGLRTSEVCVWTLIVGVTALQVALVYCLIR
ncbi:MAG TPA: FHA domain-containing protein [Verrucomicrobiae bacterium]|nr:FHA domain-containing protein [Verrucomicrobiae bacterium]